MAERRPIVIINGELYQLPIGDTLPGGGSGGSTDKNVDGGSASSVYLPTQVVDGGDANG